MKKHTRFTITTIFIAFIIITNNIIASDTKSSLPRGKISGFVFNKQTKQPIPDANIIIPGTHFGAASHDGGYYFIDNIPQGMYDITVRVIGYKTAIQNKINIGENTILSFTLNPIPVFTDPIIVTATRSDHLQSNVTVASHVLTLTHIRELNGNTAGEVIEPLGGIYFKNYDGLAGTQTPSIRGSNTNQVLVLLDDQRLNIAQGGGVDLNVFPVEDLERIEVIRGGHSALMGTDAIGGVINLISKESITPKGFSYGMNSTIGSFGTQNLNVYGSHKINALSYFLSYNRTKSNGDFVYKLPETGNKKKRENNDFKGDNIFFKTKMDLGTKNQVQLLYQYFQTDRGVIGSIAWPSPQARRKEDRHMISLRSENQITDHLRLKEQVYYNTYNNHYQNPGSWIPEDDLHKNKSLGIDIQGQINFNHYLNLITGTEYRQDKLESTKFDAKDRSTQSMFFQAEIGHVFSLFGFKTQWKWIPAVRWDKYSDVGSHTSPKLGAMIRTGNKNNISLKGNIGQSYRVPTFGDLYWPEETWAWGGGTKGNPDLKPEVGTNFDVGLLLSRETASLIQVELNYFSNNIKNLIDWGEGTDKIWRPLNIGKAKIIGLESGIKFRLPQNFAYLNVFYTWMKAIDESSESPNKGNYLIYRPNSKLDIITGLYLGPVMVNVNYRIVGKRFTSPDNSKPLSEYQLLNGNIGCSFSIMKLNIEAKLQVQNFLDKSIYLLDGYPLPGRELRFSLGLKY